MEAEQRWTVGPWARRLFRSCAPKANKNWNNTHNFYGDPKDLDATNLTDAKSFFQTYHAPNNAVLAVVGDFEPAAAKAWVEKCYGPIPSAPQPPKPDPTEPRQEREQEQRSSQDDELATKPALAFAYHMPDRNTPEYYALSSCSTRLCCKATTAASTRP